MNTIKPPLEMLVDKFTYEEYLGEGDWGQASFGEPIEVKNVRIDRGTVYSTSQNGKQIIYNGVIFCYAGLAVPMQDFKEQSRITYDGTQHIITRIDKITEPFSSDLYCYELEVV